MLEKSPLHSRLLFVIALVCAAVMSSIMCSDAARASPITVQVDNGVKYKVLRRLDKQYSQHQPSITGEPSTETGIQTDTKGETEMNGNYRVSSIIDHKSSPVRLTKGSFSYNQNIPDDRQSQAEITGALSEVRPASSVFTSHSQRRGQSFERQQSRVKYHPLSQEVAPSANSYYSHPVIIRKSSHKEAARPFHQSSQVWDPKDTEKSYTKEEVQRNYSPKVAEEKAVWQPSESPLFSSQVGGHWGTSLPTSRGHYSGYKEMNELAAVGLRSTSSGIQSSKYLSLASQTAPHAPSVSNSLDASVIKSNPSPEKLATSITDFSQGLHSVSSSETPRLRQVQSYLFKDSHTFFGGHETADAVAADGHGALSTTPHKQSPLDAEVHGRFSSTFKQLQREEPAKNVQHLVGFNQAHFSNANPLYDTANMAQYGAQTDTLMKYQSTAAETGNPAQALVPIPQTDLQGSYATGRENSVVSTRDNANRRESVDAYKPGRTTKSIYGFRGLKKPTWRAMKEPSILSNDEKINFRRYHFDKAKFKIANIFPSLSPKYSFGQREASTAPSDYSSPPPGTSNIIRTTITPRPLTSGFTEARPLLPESDVGVDSNPDRRQFRRVYGLKGFGNRPLEGAKRLVDEPDMSVQQGFEGSKLRSSQSWQPKRSMIHRWYNKTEPGSSHVSTIRQSDLEPLLKRTESTEPVTRFTPDKYKKNRKIYTHLGFQPVQKRIGSATNQTHWKYNDPTPRISSTYLRSVGDLKVESHPKSEPRPPNKTRPVAMKPSLFNTSTSSTVRGRRVKAKHANGKTLNASLTSDAGHVAIVRLPIQPARVKAVTYADIVGSASFSGVRATTQTPVAPADKGYFPNTTATAEQKEETGLSTLDSEEAVPSRDNMGRGPEAHEREDFTSIEENKLGVRSEDLDSGVNSALFLDNEGSGSGFNMSNVFSVDTRSQGLNEDLFELDYLRLSTGNVSFKSMKLSNTEK